MHCRTAKEKPPQRPIPRDVPAILAGSKEQAVYAAKWLGLLPSEFRFIGSGNDLQGTRGMKVILFGTYSCRSDWQRLRDELTITEARVWNLSDRG